ncbi:MAG: lytic transglycosylase F [Myxococcota bacterium]|nr:lytic transglycosylase F [Myxococcota bacterium]
MTTSPSRRSELTCFQSRLLKCVPYLVVLGLAVGTLACSGHTRSQLSPTAAKLTTPQIPQRTVKTEWDAIRHRGTLRVLIHRGAKYVPRSGSPDDRELAAIELFARAKELKLELIEIEARSELLDALLENRGDVIVAHLTDTPARRKRVRFTSALRRVKELVVVPNSKDDVPQNSQSLAGHTIHLRASSSYMESLLSETFQRPPRIEPLSEALDALDILSAVGREEIGMTIMDSDAVEAYQAYRHDIKVAFAIKERVPIAWAVRPHASALQQVLNDFISQYIARKGNTPVAAFDLDEIQKRGILRMVLPNTGSAFFFHQGIPMGFQYVMAQKLCKQLGVHLEVVVPRSKSDMIPLLVEGHADVIAATLTVTPDRNTLVDFATPLMRVDEVLIQPSSQPTLRSVEQLAGRTVTVLGNSSYLRTLNALRASVPLMKVEIAPPETTAEALIEGVASGKYDLTVSDFNLVAAELSYREDIKASIKLGRGRPIAYAVRKGNAQLKKTLDTFSNYWAPQLSGSTLTDPNQTSAQPPAVSAGGRPPFHDVIAEITREYGLPETMLERWMMEVSQGDPKVVSWFGGRGLLQVMPHVARRLNVQAEKLNTPEQGLVAGVRWLLALKKQLPDTIAEADALKMALAATRIGFGHINDARELAMARGWDATRWDGHVARALAELTRPEVAAGARYGYCPGSETVRFVSRILDQ